MSEPQAKPTKETPHSVSLRLEDASNGETAIAELPESISFLDTLSMNFVWSWKEDAIELFRDLDSTQWEDCEQNPRELLKNVSELRLLQKANEPEFVKRLDLIERRFNDYLEKEPKTFGEISIENPVTYFCAEFAVHNSLPIYSGGLGILAGDHLKSASDMNVPLVAIGLLYRYGYFRQKIAHHGWQEETYLDVFDHERALTPVTDENGDRINVHVEISGREVVAQAWLARIGRISLYLLDTSLDENDQIDQLITGHLYGGDKETRLVQEKVLGVGGVRLLRRLNIHPYVYHLNEGHSAFLTLELIRETLVENPEMKFEEAASVVRKKCVFTTHTPVAAGNDEFSPEMIDEYFEDNFFEALKLDRDEYLALGRTTEDNDEEWFGMTPLAIRMSRSANGVSKKHGEISRGLWKKMFPEATDEADVPISHVTNGVHAQTWIAPVFKELYEQHMGEKWTEIMHDQVAWEEAIYKIPDNEIWQIHTDLKSLLIAFLRERVHKRNTGLRRTIHEHKDTHKLFSKDILTIGFARRVAKYKRWNLMLVDIERLLKMVDDADRPVQFIFAGKAHPQDRTAKKILQNLVSINHDSNWQHRAAFIEDYDQDIARYLVRGVDVWLNVPRRPHEASGTSGQKVAMNGGLNLSVLDGWWIEGYNENNGFAIGPLEDESEDEAVVDAKDAESLYQTLENDVIPAYYDLDENGLPANWISRMKNALATLTPQFSSDRMVHDYFEKIYTRK